MGVSVTKYALLYSLYSWPNVILSVFGGYLLDRVFGVRLGTVIFSVFVCLGQVYYMYQGWTKVHHSPLLPLPLSLHPLSLQLIFSLGAFVDHYWLMLAGRFVFGSVEGNSIRYRFTPYSLQVGW